MAIPLIFPAIPAIAKGLAGLLGLGTAYVAGRELAKDPPRFFSRSKTYEPVAFPPHTNAIVNAGIKSGLNSLLPNKPAMNDNYTGLGDHVMNLRYSDKGIVLPGITVSAPRPPLVLEASKTQLQIDELRKQIEPLLSNYNNNNNNNNRRRWSPYIIGGGVGILGEKASDFFFPNTGKSDSLTIQQLTQNAVSQIPEPVRMPSTDSTNNSLLNKTNDSLLNKTNDPSIEDIVKALNSF